MHASMNNNLSKQVREEINEYVRDVENQGFIVRRVPTVELLPEDKEYEVLLERKRQRAIKEVHD